MQTFSNSVEAMDTEAVFANPVMEDSTKKTPKSQLVDLLDEVERHVDLLRRDLILLEERKDTVLTTLDTIRNSELISQLSDEETTEVELYADRLTKMCAGVEVKITTTRDQRQEEALYEVNRLIDSLVVALQSDPQSARLRCLSYVNACSTFLGCKAIEVGEEEEEESEDISQAFLPDSIFGDAMFLCTPDDRGRVQRRLNGLLAYIEREINTGFQLPLKLN